jgi:hypothetical protein
MDITDVKSWALLISLMALTLSIVTFVKTQLWSSLKLDCRMIGFSWKINNLDNFCESKFFISSSGNQNLYIDKLFIIEGEDTTINGSSVHIDVHKNLKPGEIEEFICRTDASVFSHDKTYSFIFTFISANTDQFHCSLKMSTKEQKDNSLIVLPKSFGSGSFHLHSLNFWRNIKTRKSRKGRQQN